MGAAMIGAAAAVRYALAVDGTDDRWTYRLKGPSALMVGVNLRTAAKRDSFGMALRVELQDQCPGMYRVLLDETARVYERHQAEQTITHGTLQR